LNGLCIYHSFVGEIINKKNLHKMKTSILKKGILAVSLVSCLPSVAQVMISDEMTYTVDTLKNKPWGNKLMVTAGVQGDMDYNGSGASGYYGAYGHGRFNIGRFLQVGGTFVMPITEAPTDKPDLKYNVIEAGAVLFFSSKTEKENHKFKIGHGRSNKGAINFTANMPIPKSVQFGLCGGVFNWTRPFVRGQKDTMAFNATNVSDGKNNYHDNIYTNVSASGISAGLAISTNVKAKYRFHTTKVKMHGRGEKKGKATGRRNMSADIGLELLFAPSVRYEDQVKIMKNDTLQTYTISNIHKQRMGFRVRAEVRKSIWSVRFEMGARPGVKYAMGGNGNKALSGLYYTIGLGIGIGAL
jgi:hypothetical protein